MKYMVMECHPGYAVVLDEQGQFSKVANMRYEVGQTVTDVVPALLPEAKPAHGRGAGWLYPLAAMAACLVLMLTFFFQGRTPYASVYMTINPEVRIDVDKTDMVVGLEGVNADGITLIEGYDHRRKHLDLVVDELVDRAIEMGFLSDGGKVTLTLDTEHNEWVVSHTDSLGTHLNEHLVNKMTVVIEICDKHDHSGSIHDDDDEDDCEDDREDWDDHDDHHDDLDDPDDWDDSDDDDHHDNDDEEDDDGDEDDDEDDD